MQDSDAIQQYQDVEFRARRRSKHMWSSWRDAPQRDPSGARIRKVSGTLVMIVSAFVPMAFCGPSWSQVSLPNTPTMAELTRVPPVCGPRLGLGPNAQAKYGAYEVRYGRPIWDHYHHYCYALNFMNRQALVFNDKPAKRFDLQSAINNFDYLIVHWPANSPQRKFKKMVF